MQRRIRRLGAALAVAALLLLAAGAIRAQPPPPSFLKFFVTNASGAVMELVQVKVYPSVNGHRDIATEPSTVLELPNVPSGPTVTLSLPATYGVSKIHCEITCTAGQSGEVEIVAHKVRPDPTKPDEFYAGFLDTAGPGEPSNLGLSIGPPLDGKYPLHLAGYAQWKDEDPVLAEDPGTCPP